MTEKSRGMLEKYVCICGEALWLGCTISVYKYDWKKLRTALGGGHILHKAQKYNN